MPKLTQRQENFCLAIIEGLNASDAYRSAYDVRTGTPKTVNETASRLMADPKIAARIVELREPAVIAAKITLVEHLRELASLRDAAKNGAEYGPAITAEVARGKASGLYSDKLEVTGKDGAPIIVKFVREDRKRTAG